MSKYFNSLAPGAASVATITVIDYPADGQSVTLNGTSYTFGTDIDTVDLVSQADLANRIVTALPTSDYTAVASGAVVTLTWNTVGANNVSNSTTDAGHLTVTNFSGGVAPGAADGVWKTANFFNDVGNLVHSAGVPTPTENVVLQDAATSGSGVCNDLSATGGSIAGANITIHGTSTAPLGSGSIIAFTPTYATASDVRKDTDRGDGTTGTCAVPAASKVLDGEPVDATTGNVTEAPANKVLSAAAGGWSGTYGANGTAHTGTAGAVGGKLNCGGGFSF